MNIFLQYFAFRECIAPWSIGWVLEVVFGGSPSYTAFKPSIIYYINNFTIFFFKLFIEFLYPFIKKETVYPNFHLRPIMTGKYMLYMPFSLYLDKIVGRDFSFHAFVISGVTDLDSPDTSLNEILNRVSQACNYPSHAWNFSIFNCFAKPRAFSCKIVPLIGIFSDLCISSDL